LVNTQQILVRGNRSATYEADIPIKKGFSGLRRSAGFEQNNPAINLTKFIGTEQTVCQVFSP